MGVFDAIIEEEKQHKDKQKRPFQSNFSNLSPGVQKLLSNLPEDEINANYSSDENSSRKALSKSSSTTRSLYSEDTTSSRLSIRSSTYQSGFSSEENLFDRRRANIKSSPFRSFRSYQNNRSNESLEISANVQKMLSNLPDTELVIAPCLDKKSNNNSFLHSKNFDCNEQESGANDALNDITSVKNFDGNFNPVPLGSYLHSSANGIASRTPVGRMSVGKHLQIPSESSIGTGSSTNSSEVSRPVSLTSLGSCSSSGSSGHHQVGSAYLASAESLDSDQEPSGSQGSADSGIAEQTVSNAETRVLQEVLETETVYVSDLRDVIEGYLDPWSNDPDCPLTPYLGALFSNIKEIYKFNKSFLSQLHTAAGDASKTASIFLQNDAGFSVYHEYCANYPRTMDVISSLSRDEKLVPLFREKQQALGHPLPLASYLLKPVQRILKYHLLLQRLSKQCSEEHRSTVELALATMTGVAADINNMKRKHEHAVRVHEIQAQLYGWPGPELTTLGELIAEGSFRVAGARGRRHVLLFDKAFLMTKWRTGAVLAYKFHIMCSNLMLVEQMRGDPLSFQVLPFDNPRLQCTLRARSIQHKREWTQQIKRVILENYSAVIPNHARQLVMQLGQDVQTNELSSDKWSPLKQPSTPHYLEKLSRHKREGSSRRATSQDRSFPSLGTWRRKSEPGQIPVYTAKTMPNKINKIKKTRGASKFYTDLSDSEHCVTESMESLTVSESKSTNDIVTSQENVAEGAQTPRLDLEKIVSDIVNEEFKNLKRNKNKSIRGSEPTPTIWFEDPPKLPTKADSLPRSFQLNDQIEPASSNESFYKQTLEKENGEYNAGGHQESDLGSQGEDLDHPDHKIYRKSAIRVSLLHRIRSLLSEQQKRAQSSTIWKQSSKNTGEKLANPDYVDPQKFFLSSSRSNLTLNHSDNDMMGEEPERLDMTINEDDVLTEIENRLKQSDLNLNSNVEAINSSVNIPEISLDASLDSSQCDSYYESILDDRLGDEYVRDEFGKLILKQDSFRSEKTYISTRRPKTVESELMKSPKNEFQIIDFSCQYSSEHRPKSLEKKPLRRPTNAPPPIPAKPIRLLNGNNSSTNGKREAINNRSNYNQNSLVFNGNIAQNQNKSLQNNNTYDDQDNVNMSSKSWVKAMVVRFE